ncbi:MAG: phosphonate transporter substrate-binding protein [Planctomycetota bacterium]|jgi:phosphonate transport system substrate-binding protein
MFRTITALVLAAGAAIAADLPEFTFGIIATESSQGLKKDWEPVRVDLEAAIGTPVKLYFAPDYSGVIEAMRFNKVQAGWFGNKSAIDVVDRAGGEVFCQVIDRDGNPGYWSLIIVHKDSPITTLEQLIAAGKEVTFSMGDPQSTSGTLVPAYHAFGKNGIDPYKHFKATRQANHETNALSVATKQVDASTFNTEAMFHLERKHAEKAAQLKVIWKSPLIASDPICYRTDLSEAMKAKVRGFFIGYGATEDQKAKLAPLKMSGFKASSNAQLLPYRQLAFLKDKAKLEADDKIPAADKAAKIAELQAKIDALAVEMAAAEKAATAR